MIFRDYVQRLMAAIGWARGYYGERMAGYIALLADMNSGGADAAVKQRFENHCAPDALARIGENKNLERYYADTDATYRARLLRAFSLWQEAGTKQAVERALAAYGYPGAVVYEDADWHRPPQPYWSQFWILFPAGTHSVLPTTLTYGAGVTYGSGALYGVTGITAVEVDGLRRIVQKWKPSRSICRSFIFVTGGIVYGDGHTYGDGSVYGGTHVEVGA